MCHIWINGLLARKLSVDIHYFVLLLERLWRSVTLVELRSTLLAGGRWRHCHLFLSQYTHFEILAHTRLIPPIVRWGHDILSLVLSLRFHTTACLAFTLIRVVFRQSRSTGCLISIASNGVIAETWMVRRMAQVWLKSDWVRLIIRGVLSFVINCVKLWNFNVVYYGWCWLNSFPKAGTGTNLHGFVNFAIA